MRQATVLATSPAAQALVHQALAEQHVLDETIGRLLTAIDDRQIRLGHQLAAALALLAGDPAGTQKPSVVPTDDTVDQDGRRVRVRCLGAFRLLIDGVQVENWRSGKARGLFQYLVNHSNRPIARDTLIGVLWPDPDSSTPGTSLKVTVHALRQMLAQAVGEQQLLAIQACESGYRLNAPSLWLDVDQFERSLALGRRLEAQGRTAEALRLYALAADLYRGDFLQESWDDWVLFRREGLKDHYLFVLARLADSALEARDYHTCILHCQRLLEGDRCREDTYRTLMLCHARLGQRGRARSWYELCVRILRTELDVAPELETERLYRKVLSGQTF